MLSEKFISEANRFVFQFPLPFLIFIGIVKSGLTSTGCLPIVAVTVPSVITMGVALVIAKMVRYKGTSLEASSSSDVSWKCQYVGLAVLLYMFGEEGLEKGSLLAGILILFNNALAIIILSRHIGYASELIEDAGNKNRTWTHFPGATLTPRSFVLLPQQ